MNQGAVLVGLVLLANAKKQTSGQETFSTGEGGLMTLAAMGLLLAYLDKRLPR